MIIDLNKLHFYGKTSSDWMSLVSKVKAVQAFFFFFFVLDRQCKVDSSTSQRLSMG